MKFANMHLHSVYSDGIFTPSELCEIAKAMGYGAAVLTDHDCTAGSSATKAAAEKAGLETLIGTEFYGRFQGKRIIHILGYDFDPTERKMKAHLDASRDCMAFLTRARFDACMAEKLLPELSWAEVMNTAENDAFICNEQVFLTYIKKGVYTQEDYWDFVKKFRTPKISVERPYPIPDSKEIINIIRNAGGVAVLAHPYRITDALPELYNEGIRGVEYDHPEIEDSDSAAAREFALSHSMYLTGGTDHTGRSGNNMQRGDDPSHKEGRWDMAHTPYTADVFCGATESEFSALKNRIFG